MPESFMVSHVFSGLANDFCVEMELTGSDVWNRSWFAKTYWEENPKDEAEKLGPNQPSRYSRPPAEPPEYHQFRSMRIDLVIQSGEPGKPYAFARKDAPLPIKCLVEFKKGNEDGIFDKGDLQKLRDFLKHLPYVPFGIFCSYVEDSKESQKIIESWKNTTTARDEIWLEGPAAFLKSPHFGSCIKYRTIAIITKNQRA